MCCKNWHRGGKQTEYVASDHFMLILDQHIIVTCRLQYHSMSFRLAVNDVR